MKKISVIVGLTILVWVVPAEAACRCACVNGVKQAICESTIDLKPLCIGLCPLTPPSLRPINPPTLPPLGTKTCRPQQVYNSWKGRYEWKQLCY